MELCRFLRSVKFVVQSLGRFLGRGVCHFLALVVKIGVVSEEASQGEKLREWDGIFYVLWMRGRM